MVVMAFNRRCVQSFFAQKKYSPPLPPSFGKSPILGGEPPPQNFSAYKALGPCTIITVITIWTHSSKDGIVNHFEMYLNFKNAITLVNFNIFS